MSYRGHIPQGHIYYNQPSTVAVLFDPEGGHHPCNSLGDGKFWCAGYVHDSPEELATVLRTNYWPERSRRPGAPRRTSRPILRWY